MAPQVPTDALLLGPLPPLHLPGPTSGLTDVVSLEAPPWRPASPTCPLAELQGASRHGP